MQSFSPPAPMGQASTPAGHEVFLSYHSVDRAEVEKVRRFLAERGIQVFFDRDSLTPGMQWVEALEEALAKAQAVVVFLGQEGLGSWQKRERALALDRQVVEEKAGRRFPVIPALLPGTDLEKVSGFLRLGTWIDLRRPEDPRPLEALARALRGEAGPPPETDREVLCPYRALQAFQEEDADLFFGRERFTEGLLKKLSSHGLVAVVGPSGSGKSSVVQAGLLPVLRRMKPPEPVSEIVVFTPGRRPFHALAAQLLSLWERQMSRTDRLEQIEQLGGKLAEGKVALGEALKETLRESRSAQRLVLVVDQFEELFTLTPAEESAAFISRLLQALQDAPVKLILTLRADFYGRAIGAQRELSDLIEQGVVNIGPMTREELRQAITAPAAKVGLRFEAGLVERILDQVEGQPGSLPLVEFALTNLWKQRQGDLLLNAKFDAMGGVRGALGTVAEATFEALPSDQQAVALRMLLRLVRVAAAQEEGTDTRQRLLFRELDDPKSQKVARTFVDARLLIMDREPGTNEETLEVSHEALLRGWGRLKTTLEDQRQFLLWRQNLRLLMAEWNRQEKHGELLLRGPLLKEAQGWLSRHKAELNSDEVAFIQSSRKSKTSSQVGLVLGVAIVAAFLALLGWTRTDHYRFRNSVSTVTDEKLPSTVDSEESVQWVAALVRAGLRQEAFETAKKLRPPTRSDAYVAIAEQALRKEEPSTAREAMVLAWSPEGVRWTPQRWAVVASLAVAELRSNPSIDVMQLARDIEEPRDQVLAMAAIADGLLQAGQTPHALQALQRFLDALAQIPSPGSRSSVLRSFAARGSKLFKTKEVAELMAPRLEAIFKEDPSLLAETFSLLGDGGRALAALETMGSAWNPSIPRSHDFCSRMASWGHAEKLRDLGIQAMQDSKWFYAVDVGYCLLEGGELSQALALAAIIIPKDRLEVLDSGRALFIHPQSSRATPLGRDPAPQDMPISRILYEVRNKQIGRYVYEQGVDKYFLTALGALMAEELARAGRSEEAFSLGQKLCQDHGDYKALVAEGLARLHARQPVDAQGLVDQFVGCYKPPTPNGRMMGEALWEPLIIEFVLELFRARNMDGAMRVLHHLKTTEEERADERLRELLPRLVQVNMLETALRLVDAETDKEPLHVLLVIELARAKKLDRAADLLGRISSVREKSSAAAALAVAQAESGDIASAYATAESCVQADRLRAYTAIVNQYATERGAPVEAGQQ